MNEYIKEYNSLPISLHDSYISKIVIEDNNMNIIFDQGIEIIEEDKFADQIWSNKAVASFLNIDLDFSRVIVLKGDKYEFISFLELSDMASTYAIQIIDEAYGSNITKLSGYLIGNDSTYEFIIDIYHFGSIKYSYELDK